jgi:hypothetical protein
MNYQQKYLKYKQKYIDLQKLIGGGKDSALKYFLSKFKNNYQNIDTYTKILFILQRDYHNGILTINLAGLNTDPPTTTPTHIFEQIFTYINQDKKNIDWIIKNYINNTFGEPSSLENYDRFKDAMEKYTILNNNKIYVQNFMELNDINGLNDLEKYIKNNSEILQILEQKNKEKNNEKQTLTLNPEEGINDVIKLFRTDDVIVYSPTTENGSIFYGKNTTWCTATTNNCQFNRYNELGKLYIFQSIHDPILKFQLSIENDELMDKDNKKISVNELINRLNDDNLEFYLTREISQTYLQDCYKKNKKIVLNNFLDETISLSRLEGLFRHMPELEHLTFSNIFDKQLGNILDPLVNLKSLTFGKKFGAKYSLHKLDDYILGNSLDRLISLQNLTFGWYFNQPLGDSLINLTNLKELTFDVTFDQQLSNSLDTLVNLESLSFDDNFNQPINDSLNKLVKLKYLTFGNKFNQSLEQAIIHLINLENLNVKIFLKSDKVTIYKITTNPEHKYYGINKKFCLPNTNNNCIPIQYEKRFHVYLIQSNISEEFELYELNII